MFIDVMTLRTIFDALIFGAALALMAVGLSLTYSVSRIANFAHGDIAVTGILVYLLTTLALAGSVSSSTLRAGVVTNGFETFVRLLAAFAAGAAVAVAMLWLVFRPLRARGATPLQLMVASIGVELFMRNLYLVLYALIFGTGVLMPGKGKILFNAAGVHLRENDVLPWITAAVSLTLLFIFLTKTMLGAMLRATADNMELAEATGINTALVETLAWVIGGGLTALGGVLWYTWSPPATHPMEAGWRLLAFVFAAVTLGGLGSLTGAIVASFIISFAYYPVTNIVIPMLKEAGLPIETGLGYAIPVAIVIASLLVMPEGLAPYLRRLWFAIEQHRLMRLREKLVWGGR